MTLAWRSRSRYLSTAFGQGAQEGLVGRPECRHDESDTKVFNIHGSPDATYAVCGEFQDTVTVAPYYSFF